MLPLTQHEIISLCLYIPGRKFLCPASQGDLPWLPRRHDLPWSRIKLFLWWVMWVHLAGISCLATCDVNFMDFSATFRMRLKPIYSTVFFCFEDAESYIYIWWVSLEVVFYEFAITTAITILYLLCSTATCVVVSQTPRQRIAALCLLFDLSRWFDFPFSVIWQN